MKKTIRYGCLAAAFLMICAVQYGVFAAGNGVYTEETEGEEPTKAVSILEADEPEQETEEMSKTPVSTISLDDVESIADGCTYLSDLTYVEELSFAAADHSIHLDENDSNNLLTLYVDGKEKNFIKGICAWATSEIVYELDGRYDYFTSYVGVDVSEQNDYFNTGVQFYIYTSKDGTTWTKKFESKTLKGWDNAQSVRIELGDANYLKLVADDNSDSWWAAWYDEAIYADAKLITKEYTEDTSVVDSIKTVAQYDEILKKGSGYDFGESYEKTLLQREFVNNVGYDILQGLAKYKTEYRNTIEWLMNDTETLRLYLTAGKPEGSYLNSLKVLSTLYTKYRLTDLRNTDMTEYGTTYQELYRTMILAISLTHSGNVYFWNDGTCHSDAVTRYEIYKALHLHEDSQEELIENEIFESLTVEEMRWVMNTVIDDEEIVWLNDWVREKGEGKISPYNYITYTFDYDYSLSKYYSKSNYDAWDEKYQLSDYDIPYEEGHPKLWVVFEEGSVCGGLSKTGSCIWGAYKGLPNTCVSQPAHCAYIYYTWTKDGQVKWELGNNVSGWGKSGKTEHLNVRPMNDWGVGDYTTGWNANYILLAQAAQNEYEAYAKAEEILMLADVYKDDAEKLEEVYRAALSAEKINFDAWLGLVELYTAKDSKKTEAECYSLAVEIAKTLTYYPYPMNDLLSQLEDCFTITEYKTSFQLLLAQTLTTASKATEKESVQHEAVRQVANELLGNIDTSIASFSFDGKNAGKIVLADRFKGMGVAWEYCISGIPSAKKKSSEPDNSTERNESAEWIQTELHEKQLTEEELEQLNAADDLRIHIIGVDYSDENIYVIDIQESQELPTGLYANDRENRLIGATDSMLWKYEQKDAWTRFDEQEPDLSGGCSVIVKAGATGTYLEGTTEKTFYFTKDDTDEQAAYVPLKEISVASCSSQQSESEGAAKAFDGNINTIWHTSYGGTDKEHWVSFKLKSPRVLTKLEYVPRQNGTNGRAKSVEVYVSTDGDQWIKAGSASGWSSDQKSKWVELKAETAQTEGVLAQYVKFVITECYADSGKSFGSAAMINVYEDLARRPADSEDADQDDTTTQPPENDKKDDTTQTPESDKKDDTTQTPESDKKDDTTQTPESDKKDDTTQTPESDKKNDTTQTPESDKKNDTTQTTESNKKNDTTQKTETVNKNNTTQKTESSKKKTTTSTTAASTTQTSADQKKSNVTTAVPIETEETTEEAADEKTEETTEAALPSSGEAETTEDAVKPEIGDIEENVVDVPFDVNTNKGYFVKTTLMIVGIVIAVVAAGVGIVFLIRRKKRQ